MRYFGDEDAGPEGQPDAQGLDAHGLTGEADLFGWHVDRDVLDFLAATGAVLDVDEYDMAPAVESDERG